VLAIEKCCIRKSGLAYFVEIHVQVDGSARVRRAHAIGGQVRAALRSSSHRIADALVHIEPFPEQTLQPRKISRTLESGFDPN
jgi:divalent metal cation (Fe/Co/Zn/Cd) transporter